MQRLFIEFIEKKIKEQEEIINKNNQEMEKARNDVFEQYIHKELEEDNYLSCDYINAFWNARAVYKEKKFTKKEKEIKQYISQLEALKYTPNKELYKIFQ